MLKFFEKNVDPFPVGVAEQPPPELFKFIWHYTKPFKHLLFGLLITSALIAGIEVMMFDTIGRMIDDMQQGNPADFFATHGKHLLVIALIALLVWPAITLLDSAIEHQGLLGNFAMQIRWRAHKYLLHQSTTFFSNDFAGRIATKVMQTSLSVRDAVVSVNGLMVYVAVYFTSALIIFISNDWRLGIPLIIWLGAYVLVMRYFLPKLRDVSALQADARSTMTGRMVDAYTNIQTVKMFSSTNNEQQYAQDSMQDMLDTVYLQMRLVTHINTILVALNSVMLCSVVGFGVWLWTQSIVTSGAIAVAGALSLRLQSMSQWFLWELARLFEATGTIIDGMNTLSRDISVTDNLDAPPLTVTEGRIEFDGVRFHYGQGSGLIDDFSLTIKAGERVGIIGRSGAGKSTLVNLLLRLYDTEHGRILIDGQDIRTVEQSSLRGQIAMVTQDTSLLHRTIRQNVIYGKPNASEHEILQALKSAKADEFIQNLVDHNGNVGLDAQVGERGVKLSGGQRQRIAIARVILKNAPILVLDEATSALDSEVEVAIQEQLETLMIDKTVLAIAHRLSTIARMDRLIVIDQGRIMEQGSHHELLQHNGIYARLWAHQSGGFLGDSAKSA